MSVINSPTTWSAWATDRVYRMLRAERMSRKRARLVAACVVNFAGPGKGHRELRYRIRPGKGGWFMHEMVGGDAHEEPQEQVNFVPEAAVWRLWRIVKKLVPCSAKYRLSTDRHEVPEDYRFSLPDVALALRRKKLFPRGMDTLSIGGGKRRARYYFPLYLYPCRVLDSLGLIRFGKTSWRLE